MPAVIHSRVLFPQGNLLGLTAFSLSCLSVRLNNHNIGLPRASSQ